MGIHVPTLLGLHCLLIVIDVLILDHFFDLLMRLGSFDWDLTYTGRFPVILDELLHLPLNEIHLEDIFYVGSMRIILA